MKITIRINPSCKAHELSLIIIIVLLLFSSTNLIKLTVVHSSKIDDVVDHLSRSCYISYLLIIIVIY